MKAISNFILPFVFFLGLLSCKKENLVFVENQKKLPGYSNINFKNIFSEQDLALENEDSIVNFLKNYYHNTWVAGDLSGGILIAKGNKILFEDYRGFAQPNQQEPINQNTALHVASVSKSLTAMAIMKLVEAGYLKLEDPVTKFFPNFPYPEVTVKSLLTQRSGLPKYEYLIEQIKPEPIELTKKFLTNKDILNLLVRYKPELAKPANSGFMYCNTNFALLALIAEKVTGKPFPNVMQEVVFKPLKMENSYVFQEKDTLTAAKSFYFRGNRLINYDRLDLIYGDKNVYTTPKDLFRFSQALYSENFLRKDLKDQIFVPYSNENPGVNNYGIGFRMKVFDPDHMLTFHNGWWHGSNSVFAHLLKSKVTIVAIGNKYSNRVYSALALSGLFENFPYEIQKLNQSQEQNKDSIRFRDSMDETENREE